MNIDVHDHASVFIPFFLFFDGFYSQHFVNDTRKQIIITRSYHAIILYIVLLQS